jgi:hypothetical protein
MVDQTPDFNANPASVQKITKNTVNEELLNSVTSAAKSLRILEDRYITIRKKTQLTDQNMLEANKHFNTEIIIINNDIDKLKLLMKEMNEKLDQLISETSNLAKRHELVVLSKYIDFWKPLNFITKEELDREIKYMKEL